MSNCTYEIISVLASIKERCSYVTKNCPGEYVNYFKIHYCYCNENITLSLIIYLLLISLVFYFMSETGDKNVSGALTTLVSKIRMDQNLAGLTLLAIGNGAPDVISNIIAADGGGDGLQLIFGSLLGAGTFITCFVLSCVVYIAYTIKVTPSLFLRDVLCYLLSLIWIGVIIHRSKVVLIDGIVLLFIYLLNVIIAISQHSRISRRKRVMNPEEVVDLDNDTRMTDLFKARRDTLLRMTIDGEFEEGEPLSCQILSDIINSHYFQNEDVDYSKMTQRSRVFYMMITCPMTLLKQMTIPNAEEDQWNKIFFIFSPVTLTSFVSYVFNFYDYGIDGLRFAMYLFSFLIFCSLLYHLLRCCKYVYITIIPLCIFSFVISMIWMWFAATNLVELLEIVAEILNVPQAFIGMTFLALGNSICDLSLNSKLAKTGFAEMALTGSIAGPMFNLLIGGGLALLRASLMFGTIEINFSQGGNLIAYIILVFNLIRLIIQALISNFNIRRSVSFIGFTLYVIFIMLIILATFCIK